jgi:hypothetical protein
MPYPIGNHSAPDTMWTLKEEPTAFATPNSGYWGWGFYSQRMWFIEDTGTNYELFSNRYHLYPAADGTYYVGSAALRMAGFHGYFGQFVYDDAGTNAVRNVLILGHNTSGTAAAGFGTGIELLGESSTTSNTNMARMRTTWTTATHASRAASLVLSVYDTSERDAITITTDGSVASVALAKSTITTSVTVPEIIGGTASGADLTLTSTSNATKGNVFASDAEFMIRDDSDPTKTFQFQASGITGGQNRIFTMPDASTTLVGTDTTQTITGKSIVVSQLTAGTFGAGAYTFQNTTATGATLTVQSTDDDATNPVFRTLKADGSTVPFSIDAEGRIGAYGTAISTLMGFRIDKTVSGLSGNAFGISSIMTKSDHDSHQTSGGRAQITYTGTGSQTGDLYGFYTIGRNNSTGTAANIYSHNAWITNASTGTITDARGFNVATFTNTGGGSITTAYGVYVASQTVASTNYAIYTNTGIVRFGDKTEIIQDSTTGAAPVLKLTQDDVSEEFIRFVGTSADTVLTQSIVDAADVVTPTVAGYVKVYVQDDGNQLTDQAYYMPVYTLA